MDALNGDRLPHVPLLGSLGQADLAPLSHLVSGILGDGAARPGEAVALTSTNAFSTALAALALHDAHALLTTQAATAGLAFEGFRANPSPLHPAIDEVRPFPGLMRARRDLEQALAGSRLHEPGGPRNLQDPLSLPERGARPGRRPRRRRSRSRPACDRAQRPSVELHSC